MDLPEFPDISQDMIKAIIERHQLSVDTARLLPEVGIFNAIYQLGDDFILRIPRNHPDFIAATRKEAIAAPAAVRAGVRTPKLMAFDDTLQILPVPYTIYERIHGQTLGLLGLEPTATPDVWRELGHDLAALHLSVEEDDLTRQVGTPEDLPDPYFWVDELTTHGHITDIEARWLRGWLDHLAPATQEASQKRFLHGDTQATNIMVRGEPPQYIAVLDWGACGWGDPAWDFAGIPLRVVPFLLEEYRSVASVEDETLEARILWRHLQLALFLLVRGPQPNRSWAERSAAMFMDLTRFFLESPEERWKRLLP